MTVRNDIRVLLVEDEMLIRELAAEDLADAGFRVVALGSGDEAIALLDTDCDFQLLFTDINMPGSVDGIELARRAKAAVPGLPVIYATGFSDPLADLPPNERCIRKPYAFDEVLALMSGLGIAVG